MSDRFFYKTKGQVNGPVSFGKLVEHLRKGYFSLDDHVRRDGSNEWLRADSVMKSLLAQFPEIANSPALQSSQNSKSATSTKKSKTEKKAKPARKPKREWPFVGAISSFFASITGGISAVYERISDLISDTFGSTADFVREKLLTKRGIIIITITVWMGFNAYILSQWNPKYTDEVTVYNSLGVMWSDLRQLRQNKATEEDWEKFRADVRPKIDEIVTELKGNTKPENQIRMQLLWASRDFFPAMLNDATESPSETETVFQRHMQHTARMLGQAGQQVTAY